jgi:hypothetical protein
MAINQGILAGAALKSWAAPFNFSAGFFNTSVY